MNFLLMGIMLVMLSGCGVGGFQGPDNTNGSATSNADNKTVVGQVSLGPVDGSQVAIYSLNSNGSVGQLLTTSVTNTFGHYSSSAAITGPSLYVATGGSYTDEATGQTMTIPSPSLRAAMDTTSQSMSITITPLTELAVEQASSLLIATNIASANKLVSSLFKFDIIATIPLPLTAGFALSNESQSRKDYALALAAISQMAVDYYSGTGGGLTGVLAAMNYDITNYQTLSSATSQQFTTALRNFLASANNQTGVKDINATNLVNAGGPSLTLKLSTTGSLPAGGLINGVSLHLYLPTGVTIRVTDFNSYQADSSVVYPSGEAPSSITYGGKYNIAAAGGQMAYLYLAEVSATGWSLGEFATVICDLPPGTSYTSKDFPVDTVKVIDNNGDVIQGVSVAVTVQ